MVEAPALIREYFQYNKLPWLYGMTRFLWQDAKDYDKINEIKPSKFSRILEIFSIGTLGLLIETPFLLLPEIAMQTVSSVNRFAKKYSDLAHKRY